MRSSAHSAVESDTLVPSVRVIWAILCHASGMWQGFGLVLYWCWRPGRGVEVVVHWSHHADRFVRSDPVEDFAVGLDLGVEGRPVGDVDAGQCSYFNEPNARSRTPFC